MKSFNHHLQPPVSRKFSIDLLLSSISLIVVVGVLNLAFPASSAPVTSTATSKLTVYQGVITVAPGVVGDNILELGNAGRDIAGTGNIFVRPGGVSGASSNFAEFSLAAGRTYLRVPGTVTAGYLTVSPSDTVNEGGEIALARSSGLYQDWFLDVFQSSFRIHSAGIARLIMNPSSTTIQSADIDNGFHGTILRDASGERIRTGYSNVALDNAAHNRQTADQFFWGPGSGGSDLFGSLGISSRGDVASGITLFTSPGTGLQPRLRVANNGDVYVVSGSLCFGNTTGNCSNTWALGPGGGTWDTVLAAGNTSTRSMGLGSTTVPAGTFLVHNAQSGAIIDQPALSPITGFAGDGLAAFANSTNSAIFARQQSTGNNSYAGYFSAPNATSTAGAMIARAGRAVNSFPGDPGNTEGIGFVAQHQFYNTSGPQQNLSWSRAAVFRGDLEVHGYNVPFNFPTQTGNFIGNVFSIFSDLAASSDGNLTGFPLHVNNLNPNGYAARFGGAGMIVGAPANCSGACSFARATLDVRNTYTSGANISSTGIMATGGTSGIGLDASGGNIAVRATSNGPGTHSATFYGTTLFEGTGGNSLNWKIDRPGGDPFFQFTPATWVQIERSQATTCEAACGNAAGGGKCIRAWRASTGGGAIDGSVPPAGGDCSAGYCSGQVTRYCIPAVLGCGGFGSCIAVAPACGVGCDWNSNRLLNETTAPPPAPGNNQWYEVLRCLCN